ncbi:Putative cytoplasmic protein [Ignavibacterium album JCM 16511]|uniref:Putative cytoplasmic protein n=1 Tax=Ignavibacterium album (strain DSM 19864 / JCM 16511 / NBRC 101810 / Mat9-16) TaxID=945713 RepID=I0AKT6_IGNAJ|nr:M15 family metallopeptidase [Ignavibacterium album]AFH49593.1 Putative cytoplasmic protein [Ignavibacterium album JCM 16511]
MKFLVTLFILSTIHLFAQIEEEVIIDSDMTFEESIAGINIPETIRRNLVLIDVQYYSFDEKLHQGQLVVHKSVEGDLKEIFEIIKEIKFPIHKAVPIVKYGWNDDVSMSVNNTSAFNYRRFRDAGIVSYHAKGLAIDINPLQNPQIKRGKTIPEGSTYDKSKPGTLTEASQIVKEFRKRGWMWGGFWRSSKDFQHFEKRTN